MYCKNEKGAGNDPCKETVLKPHWLGNIKRLLQPFYISEKSWHFVLKVFRLLCASLRLCN